MSCFNVPTVLKSVILDYSRTTWCSSHKTRVYLAEYNLHPSVEISQMLLCQNSFMERVCRQGYLHLLAEAPGLDGWWAGREGQESVHGGRAYTAALGQRGQDRHDVNARTTKPAANRQYDNTFTLQ